MKYTKTRVPPGTSALSSSVMLALMTLGCLMINACSITQATVKSNAPASTEIHVTDPQALYDRTPRSVAGVENAYTIASSRPAKTGKERFAHTVMSARFASWLAYYSPSRETKIRYAKAAVSHANDAIRIRPDAVEGYYYRAMATGLHARQSPLTAFGAMQKIRDDCMRAITLDETHDDGGPHRILGGLYLHAPGPPAGLGSLRRSLHHLKRAFDISADHPDNRLLLAEALSRDAKKSESEGLLTPLLKLSSTANDIETREHAARARKLKKTL